MSERPRSAGLVVHLLIAVNVLGLVFGGGVLVGWATRERRPPATEKSAAVIPDAEVKRELAACRRELSARATARVTPPATAAPPPGETDDAGLERDAKIEALHKEVEECRVRATLLNAYVCSTIHDRITLYFVLTDGMSCVDPPGLGEFLVNSLDKCAEFEDFPAHLDEDKLTREEKNRVAMSEMNHATRREKSLVEGMRKLRSDCRRRWLLPDE
jgi:hypothetical protein